MFKFQYEEALTQEEAKAYLDRIQYENGWENTQENLDRLVYCHQCTVPFEDLDIYDKKQGVDLHLPELYKKIVVGRRGGFCFELNALFVLLLRAMGYDAYSCMCRVAAGRDYFSALSHRATIVRLKDKRYVCDVGLGGPMAPFAVEVSQTRQERHGETFWVENLEEGWHLLKRLDHQGRECPVIIFSLQPFLPMDFDCLCQSLLARPDNSFRNHRIVNLRTEDGYKKIWDQVLTIRKGPQKEEIPYKEEQLQEILKQSFGIEEL